MPEIVGMNIALAVVVISIILSGIALGVGRAFGFKKLERFGLEELAQSIINAALVGAAVGIVTLFSTIAASFLDPVCSDGNPVSELQCTLDALAVNLFALAEETQRTAAILAYYQTLQLDLGPFSLQPLSHLQSTLDLLSNQTLQLQFLLILNYLYLTIISFIQENSFAYLLSAGLVFRAFFATRKLGAFLVALFIGVYLFYPLFVLLFPLPQEAMDTALEELKNFNENEEYATPPIVDLNDNYAIAEKIDILSTRTPNNLNETVDLTGDLTLIAQGNARAMGRLWVYLLFGPLVSLLVLLVLVKELTAALSAEIGFSVEAI